MSDFIEANLASLAEEPETKNKAFVEELAYLVVQECQVSISIDTQVETSFDCLS